MEHLKIKQRTSGFIESSNIIEYLLQLRGIRKSEIKHFLFPSSSIKPNYEKLDNLDEAVEKLKEHIEKGSHIKIPRDMDMDGFASAAIIYQFITKDLNYKNVSTYTPSTKVHGINVQDTLESEAQLLFVTDAGSSDFDEHKELKDNGVDVVIIDHHLVQDNRYSDDAIVVNNQLSINFKWKALTGAPMTLLFCEAYSDKYDLNIKTDKYLDLAAVGMIADRASLKDTGAFYIAHEGLKKINNPLLQGMLINDKNIENEKSITPKDVEWTIAPAINAMTRLGVKEHIELVNDALSGADYAVFNSRLKGEFSVVEESIRKMKSTRSKQSAQVKEAIEILEAKIEEKETYKNQVLFVNATGVTDNTGLNGLIAIKLASKYKRPTLVLSYNEHTGLLTGSGRNFTNSPVEDFKGELEKSGMFEYVAGHSSAFGVGIELENAMEVIEVLNQQLVTIEYDDLTHEVDISYSKKPDPQEIMEIANHEYLWGNGIERPLIHVHSIEMDKKDIKFIGKKGDTWKLSIGVVDGIMFGLSEEQKLSLTNHDSDTIIINLVGEAGINSYMGQKKPQLMIKDFEVKEGGENSDPWMNFNIDDLPF